MSSPNQITVRKLLRLIGTPACPVLVDVCIDEDFAADPRLVPGAFRYPFTGIADLAPMVRERKVIVICQKGLKLSQGAAALLRIEGIDAEYLEGGNFAWRDAGAPMIPALNDHFTKTSMPTVWVTRHRPNIDRVACPWLIRRFFDPDARFLFVSPSTVAEVADRFGAIPFDADGAFFSHRGEKCTFDVLLEEFGLVTEPLLKLATIVRGADTNRQNLAPEVAGLLAASLGLSRMYKDDLKQLEAGMMLYDAFYRWAREATDEAHHCPAKNRAQ